MNTNKNKNGWTRLIFKSAGLDQKQRILAILLSLACTLSFSQNMVYEVVTDTLITEIHSIFDLENNSLPSQPVVTIDTVIRSCTLSSGLELNGMKEGPWNFSHCTRIRENAGDFRNHFVHVKASYDGDKLNGPFTSYYSDSLVKSVFQFQNDTLHGPFVCKNENGIIIYSGEIDLRANAEFAIGKEYYSTGSFKRERTFLIEALRRDWLNEMK